MNEIMIEIVAGESYQYYPLGKYVVRAIGVCGERPTFKYTRIEITGTLDRHNQVNLYHVNPVHPV